MLSIMYVEHCTAILLWFAMLDNEEQKLWQENLYTMAMMCVVKWNFDRKTYWDTIQESGGTGHLIDLFSHIFEMVWPHLRKKLYVFWIKFWNRNVPLSVTRYNLYFCPVSLGAMGKVYHPSILWDWPCEKWDINSIIVCNTWMWLCWFSDN